MPSVLVARGPEPMPSFVEPRIACPQDLKGKQAERTGAGPGLTWSEVQDVVATNNLSRFHRRPAVLDEYHRHLQHVRSSYDSVQDYVLQELLGWTLQDLAKVATPLSARRRPVEVIAWDRCPHQQDVNASPVEEHFDGDAEHFTVLATPFPYAIPADAQHLIVWCKQPLLHPCTMHGSASRQAQQLAWRHIQRRGLSGLIPPRGEATQTYRGELVDDVAKEVVGDTDLEKEVRLAIYAAASPIRTFVEARYGRHYEVVWFANPPSLQSIPDLAHAHIMLRPRPVST